MKNFIGCIVALAALAASASASDETVTINVTAGADGGIIEATFDSSWSQGDCNEPVSRYNFTVVGGTLNQSRSIALRIQCLSPLAASVDFDNTGFVQLNQGMNFFTSGSDTLRVDFGFPSVPTMPEWGLLLLTALCLTSGVAVLLARR